LCFKCVSYVFRLLSNNVEVTALEWDLPGGKLLVADSEGQVQVWTPREHLLNDWTCLATAIFPGEHILAAAFFHNGRKVQYSF
jgi:mediator of RNA polymerase II transcription subunit 16